MVEGQEKKFNSKQQSFISNRFDRTRDKERFPFASTMSLLRHSAGAKVVSNIDQEEFSMQNEQMSAKT
jgi:hypothetical protein